MQEYQKLKTTRVPKTGWVIMQEWGVNINKNDGSTCAGIYNNGYFDWQFLESFETVYYCYDDNHTTDLILHFNGFSDIKFDISHLEKNKTELADLILNYKGSANVIFLGHNLK